MKTPGHISYLPPIATWPIGSDETASLVRVHEWSQTSLGPVEHWARSLRTVVDLALACQFPMAVLWGRDLLQIYNDAYRDLMGGKHPSGLGQPTRECWPEVWKFNEPIYARVLRGEALTFADQVFAISRHGYIEQAHFTICYSPLRGESDTVDGILITAFETTERFRTATILPLRST